MLYPLAEYIIAAMSPTTARKGRTGYTENKQHRIHTTEPDPDDTIGQRAYLLANRCVP